MTGMLKELEGVVLGLVFKQQPCTAYAIRMALKSSPSSHWQASAGSIYPLLNRLESKGLLVSAADGVDGRGRKLLHITSAGRTALQDWIAHGTAPDIVAEIHDPVRTRLFFLQALPRDEQLQFAQQTLRSLRDFLDIAEQRHAENGGQDDLAASMGDLGAVLSARARVELFEKLVQALSDE